MAAVCRHGIGFPVLGIVRDFNDSIASLAQPVQAHLFDICHSAKVDVCPIVFACLPYAGEALCREDVANRLALAHEGNLLDGPIEGIVLAEGEFYGAESALATELEGFLQFACHGGSLLGLLVGVVDDFSLAKSSGQSVALNCIGI